MRECSRKNIFTDSEGSKICSQMYGTGVKTALFMKQEPAVSITSTKMDPRGTQGNSDHENKIGSWLSDHDVFDVHVLTYLDHRDHTQIQLANEIKTNSSGKASAVVSFGGETITLEVLYYIHPCELASCCAVDVMKKKIPRALL